MIPLHTSQRKVAIASFIVLFVFALSFVTVLAKGGGGGGGGGGGNDNAGSSSNYSTKKSNYSSGRSSSNNHSSTAENRTRRGGGSSPERAVPRERASGKRYGTVRGREVYYNSRDGYHYANPEHRDDNSGGGNDPCY